MKLLPALLKLYLSLSSHRNPLCLFSKPIEPLCGFLVFNELIGTTFDLLYNERVLLLEVVCTLLSIVQRDGGGYTIRKGRVKCLFIHILKKEPRVHRVVLLECWL